MLQDVPDDHRQSEEAEIEPDELAENEGDWRKISPSGYICRLAHVTKDVTNVMQDDYHGANWQEIAEEEAEEKEARDSIVQ